MLLRPNKALEPTHLIFVVDVVVIVNFDEIAFIVNTTEGRSAIADSYAIRREALMHSVCYTTTISAGRATCRAMAHREIKDVYCLQHLHQATTA